MIVLNEELEKIIVSKFNTPADALHNALNTPSLKESNDSIASRDYLDNQVRAKNGFSTNDYYLPQFKINGE